MVVQRSPPPVRRSPRKEAAAASEASSTSFASQSRKMATLPSSLPSTASQPEPSTPLQHAPLNDFPSLDQMAAVSKEQRSVSKPSNRAAFAANFPATSANLAPSSLPRPTAQIHRIAVNDENDENPRSRAARSSLTNGAMQRVRQQAGDETPLGVSQARAARQAAAMSSSRANSSLQADDSGDSTAQLVPGRRDPVVDPIHATIDVDNPQVPSLKQSAQATRDGAASAPSQIDNAADTSAASQASIFGTGKRRNGQDQPIGAASAGTAYDFSKYLDGELDPFNRASRANPRRESRPIPVQQQPLDNDDEADTSGDTTARGGLTAPTASTGLIAPPSAPIESTPLISRVKAAATPRMSPHASPSISSRKLAHLSALSNGNSTPLAGPSSAAAADLSTASHHRFDPTARTDRIQTMEMGELRKTLKQLTREVALAQDALVAAKEESEGWASECTGLQEQLVSLKSTHSAALAREQRARNELQVRLSQYKIEADDRAWKLLAQRRQMTLVDVALQHAKNEATYHEGKYHATESELEAQKDELRIRLMLEKKRADLLALNVKAAIRDSMRLKKKLSARSIALAELQSENEKLAEQLEEASQSRRSGAASSDETRQLRKQLEEAQAEIETLNERDAMMAETRKTWKAERKQLLAQVEELSSAPPAPVAKSAEPLRVSKLSKPAAAVSMPPPSSPVYAKKKQPMQGASELGSQSDDEDGRRAAPRKAPKAASPLVPFAQISSKPAVKAAPVKKSAKPLKAASSSNKAKTSKNWRDEVAITDSSEEDSEDDRRRRRRRASPSDDESDNGARTKAKPKKKTATSSKPAKAVSKKNQPSMPAGYADLTCDPSATPVIRSNKRSVAAAAEDSDDEPADSSVLGSKFGRDRTNLALPLGAGKSKLGKLSKPTAGAADKEREKDAGGAKKKKRKLLGGGGVGGAMQWGAGGGGNGASEAAGLAPNFDIPLELSPIKGGGAAGRGAAGAAFLAGFGLPARNPFA